MIVSNYTMFVYHAITPLQFVITRCIFVTAEQRSTPLKNIIKAGECY